MPKDTVSFQNTLHQISNKQIIDALDLSNQELTSADALQLATALQSSTTISRVILANNNIGADGAIAIADVFKTNVRLAWLNFNNNPIGDVGAKAFAEMLNSNKVLNVLTVGNSSITDEGAGYFSNALENNNVLTRLSLNENAITEVGAAKLAAALTKNNRLSYLDMLICPIRDAGAIAFANALSINTGLTTLSLNTCGIGATGAMALINMLQNQYSLAFLDLSNNLGVDTSRLNSYLVRNQQYPIVINNRLQIKQNVSGPCSIVVTSNNIQAKDYNNIPRNFTFNVTDVRNGTFYPSQFNQEQVNNGMVRFMYDGSGTAGFCLTVSNGLFTTPKPRLASVSLIASSLPGMPCLPFTSAVGSTGDSGGSNYGAIIGGAAAGVAAFGVEGVVAGKGSSVSGSCCNSLDSLSVEFVGVDHRNDLGRVALEGKINRLIKQVDGLVSVGKNDEADHLALYVSVLSRGLIEGNVIFRDPKTQELYYLRRDGERLLGGGAGQSRGAVGAQPKYLREIDSMNRETVSDVKLMKVLEKHRGKFIDGGSNIFMDYVPREFFGVANRIVKSQDESLYQRLEKFCVVVDSSVEKNKKDESSKTKLSSVQKFIIWSLGRYKWVGFRAYVLRRATEEFRKTGEVQLPVVKIWISNHQYSDLISVIEKTADEVNAQMIILDPYLRPNDDLSSEKVELLRKCLKCLGGIDNGEHRLFRQIVKKEFISRCKLLVGDSRFSDIKIPLEVWESVTDQRDALIQEELSRYKAARDDWERALIEKVKDSIPLGPVEFRRAVELGLQPSYDKQNYDAWDVLMHYGGFESFRTLKTSERVEVQVQDYKLETSYSTEKRTQYIPGGPGQGIREYVMTEQFRHDKKVPFMRTEYRTETKLPKFDSVRFVLHLRKIERDFPGFFNNLRKHAKASFTGDLKSFFASHSTLSSS